MLSFQTNPEKHTEETTEVDNENAADDGTTPSASASNSVTFPATANTVSNRSRKRQHKKIEKDEDEMLRQTYRFLASATPSTAAPSGNDELAVFGKFVAYRLRSFDADLQSSAMGELQRTLLDFDDAQAVSVARSFTPLTEILSISPVPAIARGCEFLHSPSQDIFEENE